METPHARRIRLVVRFLELNWRRLLSNVLAIVAWAAILIVATRRFGRDRWLLDFLLFSGIVLYAFTMEPFQLPDWT